MHSSSSVKSTSIALRVLTSVAMLISSQQFTAAVVYENLSLGRPTWQSSDYDGRTSDKAVDGGRETAFDDGTCIHTARDRSAHPWWTVDLGQMYNIYGVNVTTRSDCCIIPACQKDPCQNGGTCEDQSIELGQYTCSCTSLFTGVNCEVHVSVTESSTIEPETSTQSATTNYCSAEILDSFIVGLTNIQPTISTPPTVNNIVKCGQWPGVAPMGQTLFVECASGLSPARYVIILPPSFILTLCEVEVYGALPAASKPTSGEEAIKKCMMSSVRQHLKHKTAKTACVRWLCGISISFKAHHRRRCRKERFQWKRRG